jgi:pimeloyl-ACP methyl ester carboxylesterase
MVNGVNALPTPPKSIFALTEASRAIHELLGLLVAGRWLSSLPGGDNQPVMALPGFGASDASTRYIRKYAGKWGYDARTWEMGRNLYPNDTRGLDGVLAFMDQVTEQVGETLRVIKAETGEKTSLVGWSLGGIYSRQVAAAYPDLVRQVITMGTPFGDPRANIMWKIIRRVADSPEPTDADLTRWVERATVPIDVPLSVIWSNSDGIVSPEIATQPEAATSENIHVVSSHSGFLVNPLAFYVLADRLAQPADNWQPFERRGLRKHLFK